MIKIIVDSTSDIPKELVEKYKIRVLPITVDINGVIYKDKVDLYEEEFYSKIKEKDVIPKTAQINPSVFEEAFREELEKGNEIICMTISSELSGTYNSANIAKNIMESEKIHVIDSRSATMGFGLIAIELAKLVEEGKNIEEVLVKAKSLIERQGAIGYVNSLEMLKRGGRISASTAMIGGALGIKPILTILDGKIESIGKARGKKNAIKQLINAIKENNIDEEVGLYIAHSNIEEGCEPDLESLVNNDVNIKTTISTIGPAVGTHVGEGTFVVFYVKKE